jgi:hypothetical protein
MTGRDRTVHAYVDVNDPLVRLPAFTLLEFCNFSLAKFLASISLYVLVFLEEGCFSPIGARGISNETYQICFSRAAIVQCPVRASHRDGSS